MKYIKYEAYPHLSQTYLFEFLVNVLLTCDRALLQFAKLSVNALR